MTCCLNTAVALAVTAHRIPFSAQAEWWPQVRDSLTTPAGFVVIGVGLFGLLIGYLLGRKPRVVARTPSDSEALPELLWRHEKLVLLERQHVEKQVRVDRFAEALADGYPSEGLALAAALFALCERVREARHRVGTDLSRLQAVDGRLERLELTGAPRPEAISACRGMARRQSARLSRSRDVLRSVHEVLMEWEEPMMAGELHEANLRRQLRGDLVTAKRELESLDPGWEGNSAEVDRQIRDLLKAGQEVEFESIRSILLVDGAETESLAAPEETDSLADSVRKILEMTSHPETDATVKVTPPLVPDSGFRAPSSGEVKTVVNGAGHRPGGARLKRVTLQRPESGDLVVFRSNDAALWGRDTYQGANRRARKVDNIPGWVEWISIRRLDTGDRVLVPGKAACAQKGDCPFPFGFNGTNEFFYGARHLGIFSDTCPNDVETRFTYGGWGFGHRSEDSLETSESMQACGWEGREIPSGTVFEIVFHSALPVLSESDIVLSPETHLIPAA